MRLQIKARLRHGAAAALALYLSASATVVAAAARQVPETIQAEEPAETYVDDLGGEDSEAYYDDDSYGSTACGESVCDGVGCGDSISSLMSAGAGQGNVFWGYGEYLGWQISGARVPALVTAAPAGTPLANAGVIGQPTTQVLFGNRDIDDDYRSGFRVGGGLWIDRCDGLAIIGDYFWLQDDGDSFSAGPNSGQIIGRPFFNTEAGVNDVQLVDVPNELSGNVRIDTNSEFQGAGVALMKSAWMCCDPCTCRTANIGLIGGYRYYRHESTLDINEDLLVLPGTTTPLVPGTTIMVNDSFATKNEFHGGEIGLQGRVNSKKWFVDGVLALGLGGTHREVDINGSTSVNVLGTVSNSAGGLLTSSATNIGHYEDDEFSVIPRIRLGVGRQLNEHFSLRGGYNVIIWNNVMFADDALPPGLAVDPRNLPPVQAGGGPDPRFPGFGNDSTLVAHGFDAGIQFSY